MSIALVIKVYDGVVLASDSASTLFISGKDGPRGVLNVYNNADKIINLSIGKPIGMIGWGMGGIGGASISTLAKDVRRRFMSEDNNWNIKSKYKIEDVVNRVRKFFYKEKYLPVYHDAEKKPTIAFFIAGYSSESEAPEVWQVTIKNGESPGPICLRDQKAFGINWGGEIETIHRLIKGVGLRLPNVLGELGIPKEQIEPAFNKISSMLEMPLVVEAMPIQDAIDLAQFLVKTTIEFVRFIPGAPTVGGPIDIAVISKHEGFKWIQRKYYFDLKYNPRRKNEFTI